MHVLVKEIEQILGEVGRLHAFHVSASIGV
jgi:hypothetical protein